MTSESSDSDFVSDWTIVSADQNRTDELFGGNSVAEKELDSKHLISNNPEICKESENEEKLAELGSNAMLSDFAKNDHLLKAPVSVEDETSSLPRSESSLSSDVDVIDENLDGHLASMESSLASHTSAFSFLSPSVIETEQNAALTEENYDFSSPSELDQEPNISEGIEVINENSSASSLIDNFEEQCFIGGVESTCSHSFKLQFMALNFTVFLFVGVLTALIFNLFDGKGDRLSEKQLSDAKLMELKQLQDDILKCLGWQQLADIKNSDPEGLHIIKVCYDSSDSWRQKFQLLQDNQHMMSLLHNVQKELVHGSSETANSLCSAREGDLKELQIDLIVRQMEYLGLLSAVENKDLEAEDAKQEEFSTDHLSLQKMKEQENLLIQLGKIVGDLKLENMELKRNLQISNREKNSLSFEHQIQELQRENEYLKEMLQNIQAQFLSSSSEVTLNIEEATEKNDLNKKHVPELLDSKIDGIKEEIEQLKQQVDLFHRDNTAKSDKIEMHDDDDDASLINTPMNKDQIPQNEDENIADNDLLFSGNDKIPQSGDAAFILSLAEQLEHLHQSLKLELSEVKRWNEIIESIATELKDAQKHDTNNWSWSDIKNAFRNTLLEAQEELSTKFNTFQNFSMSELFQNYISDSKKNFENLFKAFGHFFENAQKKSNENFKDKMPNFSPEEAASGLWKVVEKLQQKWVLVKEKVNKIAEDIIREEVESSESNENADFENTRLDSANEKYIKDGEQTVMGIYEYFDDDFIPYSTDRPAENVIKTNDEYLHRGNTDWYFKRGKHKNNFMDITDEQLIPSAKRKKGDWIFKRAADREKFRQNLRLQDDWYLRRATARNRHHLNMEKDDVQQTNMEFMRKYKNGNNRENHPIYYSTQYKKNNDKKKNHFQDYHHYR